MPGSLSGVPQQILRILHLEDDANDAELVKEMLRAQGIAECRRLDVEAYLIKPVDFPRFAMVIPQLGLQWVLLKSGSRTLSADHPRAGLALA